MLHGSQLHGTAIRYAAEERDLATSIAELREMADGRNDVLAEAAGITAGSWYASPEAPARAVLSTCDTVVARLDYLVSPRFS
jgi:hypothetical protein